MEDGIFRRLQHHHKTCCEKGSHHGRRTCRVWRWHHHGDVVFQTGGLVYDNFERLQYYLELEIIKYVFQLLNNRFIILLVKEYIRNNNLKDIFKTLFFLLCLLQLKTKE